MDVGQPLVRRELLLAAVGAAILAPSLDNSQPWRFRLNASSLDILSGADQPSPVSDPTGWAMRIACGAAAFNAQLTLLAAGVPTRMRLFPDPRQPDLLIRLEPTGAQAPTSRDVALADAISRRHSNRRPFHDRQVSAAAIAELQTAARCHGVWLDILIGRLPLIFVAEIVDAAERALHSTPQYVEALATGWSGLPAARNSSNFSRTDGLSVEPLVAALGTALDTPSEQLTAGVALQHVLLAAVDAGLSVALRSELIQVPSAREQLRLGLRRSGTPQIVARIGYAAAGEATTRRAATVLIA